MIAVINGKIVTPDAVVEGKKLLVDDDRILGLFDGLDNSYAIERTIDARGRYVMPGFIDVHSDTIEQFIQPRPSSQLDFEFALKVCERYLLGAGITTMYHSISLFKDEFLGKSPVRTKESVQRFSDLLDRIHERCHLIRHRCHLRIEIDNIEAFDIVSDMIEQGKIHQISFMDHSPGQGQYKNLDVYYKAVSGYDGKEIKSLTHAEIQKYHDTKPKLSLEQLGELARIAHAKSVPVASHDDDTEEKITANKKIDVDISEFPVTLAVAKAAKKHGLYTVVGSANILRGGSHSGNLSAAEAVLKDCADILCSDYYPAAILQSIFIMHAKHGVPLPQMVNKATLNPAKAMRIDGEYGSIEKGKKADLLIVDVLDGCPVITHVFVDGHPTSRIEYRK